MKTKPTTKYIVLGALYDKPMHGYDIMLFLKDHLRAIWYVGTSQLYSLLKKLEEKNLIQSETRIQLQRPSKQIHQLTDHGRSEFLTWVSRPCGHIRDIRIEFMAKLFFIYRYGLEDGRQLAELQKKLLSERLGKLESESIEMMDAYQLLLRDLKIRTINNWILWIDQCALVFISKHCIGEKDV